MYYQQHTLDTVRQRQADAQLAAEIHRSTKDLRAACSLRSGLARLLIRIGQRLSPTATPSIVTRPKAHFVKGWYNLATYRAEPTSC